LRNYAPNTMTFSLVFIWVKPIGNTIALNESVSMRLKN
jgi:hypothetical protein